MQKNLRACGSCGGGGVTPNLHIREIALLLSGVAAIIRLAENEVRLINIIFFSAFKDAETATKTLLDIFRQ